MSERPTSPPALPPTYALPVVSVDEAIKRQHRLLERVCAHFDGRALLSGGDLGVSPEWGQPAATRRAEHVLADYFGAADAAFVQGAGTGALRAALFAAPGAAATVVVHDAPVYATTATTFAAMSLHQHPIDFNDSAGLASRIEQARPDLVYVQHARQAPTDRYDPAEVVAAAKEAGCLVIVDDNYTAFRVPRIGVELGADASAFSAFKLLGPEGVGVVVGARALVERVRADNYSGGGQVQGHQALDVLRALAYVPVAWAIQSQVVTEVATRLAAGEVPGVAEARIANAQDLSVLVRLDAPLVRSVIGRAVDYGAAPYPVGANSRYEIAPLFYRLSGSFLAARPELRDWAIRINPMRAGADLVISILARALEEARCS